jgi:hypothetical protein
MKDADKLYGLFPDQRDAIKSLADDPEFQKHLPELVLKGLSSSGRVIPVDSNVLQMLFGRADFADTEEACRVAGFFSRYFSTQKRFLPIAVDHLNEFGNFKDESPGRRDFI